MEKSKKKEQALEEENKKVLQKKESQEVYEEIQALELKSESKV